MKRALNSALSIILLNLDRSHALKEQRVQEAHASEKITTEMRAKYTAYNKYAALRSSLEV